MFIIIQSWDEDGDERNDCDQNSRVLTHSWPDSHSSPDSIIFFTSDDDGETESFQIAYTMGGMSLKLAESSVSNASYSTASANDHDGRTIALSLAF